MDLPECVKCRAIKKWLWNCSIWHEERLRDLWLFSLEKRSAQGNLIHEEKHVMGGKEEEDRLLSVVPTGGTSITGHKLKHEIPPEHNLILFCFGCSENPMWHSPEQSSTILWFPKLNDMWGSAMANIEKISYQDLTFPTRSVVNHQSPHHAYSRTL